jgi:Phage tail assembly chaperone protein
MTIYYSNSVSGFIDTDAISVPIPPDAFIITKEQQQQMLFELNANGKSVVVDSSNNISFVNRALSPITWDIIRNTRDTLLTQSDWTQVSDFKGNVTAWQTYRQELRDIPQTYSTPESVVFPTAPSYK